MSCSRLEDDGLLAELGGQLDGHIEQCPDCSARMRGYRRIASWIAEGKTLHRAPPALRRRTLARVLASPSPVQPRAGEPRREVEGPTLCAAASTDLRRSPPATSSGATPSGRARARVPVSGMLRRRGSRVVLPIASAAVITAVASTVLLRGDAAMDRASRSESPPSTVGTPPPARTPPPLPGSRGSTQPAEPAAQAIEAHTDPHQRPTPPPAATERPDGRPGMAPAGEVLPGAGERRGGTVTVDWEPEAAPTPPGPPAIELVIETIPPGAQVILGNTILGTTPFRRWLLRDVELVIRSPGYRDVVVAAARHVARPIELVPIDSHADDARDR